MNVVRSARRVWIDLSTAPDPLFFRPIVRRFKEAGHRVWVTAREYGETVAIARECGLEFESVGEHGGQSLTGKAVAVARRATRLAEMARKVSPDVAVSFNSYAQCLAAKWCHIPFVTIMDYEYQPANHLAFRLAQRVIVPEGFDSVALRRYGAQPHRVIVHPGLKEHVTLIDFVPDPHFRSQLERLGVSFSDILVTMRPPPTRSSYHRFDDGFFEQVVIHVGEQRGVKVVVLPRYDSQREWVTSLGMMNVLAPDQVLDGLNLVHSSDLVVSAGGSMNREAVVLGTPAVTAFRGRMAGVDRKLLADGQLGQVTSSADLPRLIARKKISHPEVVRRADAIETIIRTTLEGSRAG